MARIAGIDLPRDKRIEISLTYIYGIGLTTSQKLLAEAGINPDTRTRDLTEDEVVKLRELKEIVNDQRMFIRFERFYLSYAHSQCTRNFILSHTSFFSCFFKLSSRIF